MGKSLPQGTKAFEDIKGKAGTIKVTYDDNDKGGYDWAVSVHLHIHNLSESEAWELATDLHTRYNS